MAERSESAANPQRLGLGRRLQKLRAMSWAEISTRLSYRAYCAWEERAHRRGHFADPDRLRKALPRRFARSPQWATQLIEGRADPRLPWLPGAQLSEREALRTLFGSQFAHQRQRSIEEADRVMTGRVSFFGKTASCTPDIDWHADPFTQRRWPVVYHGRVPSAGGDVGYGDIKHVWEINRHQFFIDLAKAYALTGDDRYATRLHELHASWCAHNPYGMGVNWSCALEPAFRVLSWLWAYPLVADATGERDHLRWLEAFLDHGRFLHRHLEYYTSPYNHLIGEATALFLLGALFPEFTDAASWLARGRRVLERSAFGEFHADGGTVEQSTFYHHATLGFYLLAALTAERMHAPLSKPTQDVIIRALEFSMHVQQPDGRVPSLGGADDGKPIRLEHLPFWDFRPYLAVGAVAFARADFKTASSRFWEDALWLLGPQGQATFDRLGTALAPASLALPASGYVVLRDRPDTPEHYVCFDCGPQAAGLRRDDIPSAAHGHADCLSVVLWLRGQPVLVDSGFYCYNANPEWEAHFRKTRAHNTLEVDGTDQAVHVSKMAWCRTYTATLHGWNTTTRGAWAQGSHDGYGRLPSPARHQRTIHLRHLGYAAILDIVEGIGRNDVALHFHFAPGEALLRANECRADLQGRAALSWFSPISLDASLTNGNGTAPTSGWIAASLEVAVAAPYLRLDASAVQLPVAVMTLVHDTTADLRVEVIDEEAHGRIVEVQSPIGREWVHVTFPTPANVIIWTTVDGALSGETIDGRPVDAAPPSAVISAVARGASR